MPGTLRPMAAQAQFPYPASNVNTKPSADAPICRKLDRAGSSRIVPDRCESKTASADPADRSARDGTDSSAAGRCRFGDDDCIGDSTTFRKKDNYGVLICGRGLRLIHTEASYRRDTGEAHQINRIADRNNEEIPGVAGSHSNVCGSGLGS
ncbi:MAG: hypothetical protein H6Q05_3801 [Acidobacteria bacterium]|nr:hypothetical protein [Acidobacteriota bacterium]